MFNKNYGFEVPGYEERVVNEREVRAASGIMFILGILSAFNALALDHLIMAQVYISAFVFDFSMRFILPNHSPSLLLGKLVVKNQKPEYVGAVQKKFAWMLGLMLALPVFNAMVINDFNYSHIIAYACILCLFLLFNEAAFGICYGCLLYKFFTKKDSKYCPGGSCEIKITEESQKFSPFQVAIVVFSTFALVAALYLYTTKLENKTYFGEHMQELLLTKDMIKQKKEAEYQKEVEAFMEEDEEW